LWFTAQGRIRRKLAAIEVCSAGPPGIVAVYVPATLNKAAVSGVPADTGIVAVAAALALGARLGIGVGAVPVVEFN
jgi:hypothetical protein